MRLSTHACSRVFCEHRRPPNLAENADMGKYRIVKLAPHARFSDYTHEVRFNHTSQWVKAAGDMWDENFENLIPNT